MWGLLPCYNTCSSIARGYVSHSLALSYVSLVLWGSLLLQPHLYDWVLIIEAEPILRLQHLGFEDLGAFPWLIPQLSCHIIYHSSLEHLLDGGTLAQVAHHVGVIIGIVIGGRKLIFTQSFILNNEIWLFQGLQLI
jgi:hypothetical protein